MMKNTLKVVWLHEKPHKKRKWNSRLIKVEEVKMISINLGLLMILLAAAVVVIGIQRAHHWQSCQCK